MALFVDGDLSSIDDLKRYESSILDVAGTQGIALDAKLEVAHRELKVSLLAFLAQRRDLGQAAELGNLMVTDALTQWHTLQTLSAVFRDAYNSQVNDRYAGKWKEYVKLAERTASLALDIGVGMTSNPVRRPSPPVCSTAAGGGMAERTYFIQIAWSMANARSALSPVIAFSIPAAELAVAAAQDAPANAAGFHVFAGLTPETVRRQTASPVVLGSSWMESAAGLGVGLTDVPEQAPDYFIDRLRTWNRG